MPGAGAGEHVEDVRPYLELREIPDWRRVLSNFHVAPFVYEGATWNSIEHVFQGKKIALVDGEKGSWFTREGGHMIGQGDGVMARKNRKLVVLGAADLARWAAMKEEVLYGASMAKVTQVPEAAQVLQRTGKAQLWHIVMRGKPERFTWLERVREELFGAQ